MNNRTLPEHLRVLGEQARQLRALLARGLASKSAPSAIPAFDFPERMRGSLRRLEENIIELTDTFNGPVQTEAAKADGDARAIYRAVGRIEQVLERMTAEYRDACNFNTFETDAYPKQLLLRGHRDLLYQFDAWLAKIVDVVDDPAAAIEAAGLRADKDVALPINLKFKPSPAIAELTDYYQRFGDHLHQLAEHQFAERVYQARVSTGQKRRKAPTRNRSGFCSTVGAAALGFLIGDMLFGDDCDE